MATNKEMIKVDELNRLYNSNNPNDIIKFYGNFNTPEELIGWSRSRPHGRAKIYTVKGDTDIVVVIPTADRHGKYAKNCEKEIFKGQQIVFVESGGRDDPYFNYARNCNIGLRYALRYKPKWIILSNDDVYKIDDLSVLKNSLYKINSSKFQVVYTQHKPDYYHSFPIELVKRNFRSRIFKTIFYKNQNEIEKLLDKYNIKYIISGAKNPLKRLIRRIVYFPAILKFRNVGDFTIFSTNFIKERNGKLFDEGFISDLEDAYLSMGLTKTTILRFIIGSHVGNILGRGEKRGLKDVFNLVYLNKKLGK